MKKFILGLFAFTSFTFSAQSLAQDLQAVMKNMGGDFKKISLQVSDSSKNDSTLSLADDLLKSIQEARGLQPDSLSSLPPANQPVRLELYLKMIDHAAELTQQFIDTLKAGDNAKAKQIFDSLTQAKLDGHREFK